MTFDSWDVGIHPETYLAHHGIIGMKHGRNRYQTESGEWTEEGLERRRKREGFGESRKERKAAKALAKAERHEARRQARAEAMAAYAERRRQKNIKNLTDEELQKRINRLEMEKKYKELNKSPFIEAGSKIVKAYFDAKDKKAKQEMDKANLVIRDRESKAKLTSAKAEMTKAKSEMLDNVIRGKGYMKAKNDLLNTKSKTTIGGAIRKSINSIITKEGRGITNDMPDHSLIVAGGRKVKNAVKKSTNTAKEMAKATWAGAGEDYLNSVIKKNNKKAAKKAAMTIAKS